MVRIGLLEDNDDTRVLMRLWLEMSGYEVVEWKNGGQLLEGVSTESLDLALIDLWLPDVNGLTLPETIRVQSGKDLPLIAITAHATSKVRIQVLAAGFKEFITKPVDFDELTNAMNRVLFRRQTT